MIALDTLFSYDDLLRSIEDGYVRSQTHPDLPLRILNYTKRCAYERAWTDVTRQCRGLIYREDTFEVVARPFPKFFNHGEPLAPELDLDAPATVTEKMDGSLGILYPTRYEHAIATRGSFTSEQALHATGVLRRMYARWKPRLDWTYLFEVVYPENRIVVDYNGADDLYLLAVIDTNTGCQVPDMATIKWPGPRADTHPYRTLADALRAEPRPNREGLVVYLPDRNERVKIKQDDYVALHRVLTDTSARNVWEVAAVQRCHALVSQPKHWGSYLGIDPARAEEVLALGDDWLAGVPDEFYGWVASVIEKATRDAEESWDLAIKVSALARDIPIEGGERYRWVSGWTSKLATDVLRLAANENPTSDTYAQLWLRCWREARPDPSAPFARSESVA